MEHLHAPELPADLEEKATQFQSNVDKLEAKIDTQFAHFIPNQAYHSKSIELEEFIDSEEEEDTRFNKGCFCYRSAKRKKDRCFFPFFLDMV
jgi:hypothetical protein